MSDWIEEEISYTDLEDPRLDLRLGKILHSLNEQTASSLPVALKGHAELTAAYRFFSNPKVTFDLVLESHIEKSLERFSKEEVVLLVGDTTEIVNKRPERTMKGVGEIDSVRRGTLLHLFSGFTESGVALGATSADLINREYSKDKKKASRPIKEKESYRWLLNQRTAKGISEELPGTKFVTIYDSEADMFEVLSEFDDESDNVDFIVRGCQDRKLANESIKLKEKVLKSKVLYKQKLSIRSRTKKIKCSKGNREQEQKARESEFEVRARSVNIKAPKGKGVSQEINVISVREKRKPNGQNRIEWMLLTSLPIETKSQIRKVVKYYSQRWMIEIFFKVLKSGCKVEELQFQSIENFEPCLAVYLIVSWRILYITKIARILPDEPCSLVFTENEWKAVYAVVKKKKPPKAPPKLKEINLCLAQLGGYSKRKNSPPGIKTIWVGMMRLKDIALGWEMANHLN